MIQVQNESDQENVAAAKEDIPKPVRGFAHPLVQGRVQ